MQISTPLSGKSACDNCDRLANSCKCQQIGDKLHDLDEQAQEHADTDLRKDNLNATVQIANQRQQAIIIAEGEMLRFERISRYDMGWYMCIAANGVQPSVSQRIFVPVMSKQHFQQPQADENQHKITSSATSNLSTNNANNVTQSKQPKTHLNRQFSSNQHSNWTHGQQRNNNNNNSRKLFNGKIAHSAISSQASSTKRSHLTTDANSHASSSATPSAWCLSTSWPTIINIVIVCLACIVTIRSH